MVRGRSNHLRLLSAFIVSVAVLAPKALAQDDEVVLTALRSRAAFVRAMGVAASQMGAIGDGSITSGTWRSGIITHTERVTTNGRLVSLDFHAYINARLQGELPDSVKARFRAEVSSGAIVSGSDRSTVARAFLVEFVTRTNRALTADQTN